MDPFNLGHLKYMYTQNKISIFNLFQIFILELLIHIRRL